MTNFRCLNCGAVKALDFPDGRLHIRPDRDGEHPCACGGLQWVQVGSTTEYYRFWSRADVCRPGGHVSVEAREYELRFPPSPEPSAAKRVGSLFERACPTHLAVLAKQWPEATILPVSEAKKP